MLHSSIATVEVAAACCGAPKSMLSNIDTCPDARSFWADEALATTCSSRWNIVARVSPVQSSAPALIRFSRMRLLTAFESRRVEKSSSDLKGPFASRSATAWAIAPSPTFLIAASP